MNSLISLAPGEFKIYGNSSVTLSVDENLSKQIDIIPNPSTNFFRIGADVNEVRIFDTAGRLVKEFNGNFSKVTSFDISQLAPALYIVNAKSDLGLFSKKLIKH